jgi:hypothetical protein
MDTSQNTSKSTVKKNDKTEDLKTEPMSEKDEVKEAERKMYKFNKKAAAPSKAKKGL